MQKKIATLYIIGLGPGTSNLLPSLAIKALEYSQVIVGYGLYVDMIEQNLRKDKEIIITGMRHEQERCLAAIAKAQSGLNTSIVCSGDAGIYGMSGLILELLQQQGLLEKVIVEVIPGIPAVCAAAALLGAPLMHDFACISLSDLLTPWQDIVKRINATLSADFVIALYNPRSKGRKDHLQEIINIAKQYRSLDTPIGLVRNAYRSNQEVKLYTLENFPCENADMLSIVIIGNSNTKQLGSYMVTPRGYKIASKEID